MKTAAVILVPLVSAAAIAGGVWFWMRRRGESTLLAETPSQPMQEPLATVGDVVSPELREQLQAVVDRTS